MIIENNINVILGELNLEDETRVVCPFDEDLIDFVGDLSRSILRNKNCKQFPDIITFGYWCRPSNIKKLKSEYDDLHRRKGLGIVLHIAPSNVPVNFAFSFIFGLLSGNSNIIKLPSKEDQRINLLCSIIQEVLSSEKYSFLSRRTLFIKYENQEEITKQISSYCMGRMIWGSDETILKVKSIQASPRCIDISFPDRYSLSIIHSTSILKMEESLLNLFVDKFFNDTYLMDQNACSSAKLIFWLASDKQEAQKAQSKFWDKMLIKLLNHYELSQKSSIDKLTKLYVDLSLNEEIDNGYFESSLLYRISMKEIPKDINKFNGNSGYFYELIISELKDLELIMNKKIQTLTYYGIDGDDIFEIIRNSNKIGIDRIVPVGQALDIGIIWDGFDLIRSLSKVIDLK